MDKEIKTFCQDSDEVQIDASLALRFLRVRREPDEETKAMFAQCIREFKDTVSYKASYRVFDISIEDNKKIYFDDAMVLESEKLAKNLSSSSKAFVFVATTCMSVDRLINKYMNLRVSRAIVLDAIGSAAIEGFCDMLCDKLQNDYSVSLCPRFSPGYGDLSILCQPQILGICDSSRKIGVTLTDNHMMLPRKSVSAIVGIKESRDTSDNKSKCSLCENTDCQYRE